LRIEQESEERISEMTYDDARGLQAHHVHIHLDRDEGGTGTDDHKALFPYLSLFLCRVVHDLGLDHSQGKEEGREGDDDDDRVHQ
jgi:hypothetical protein